LFSLALFDRQWLLYIIICLSLTKIVTLSDSEVFEALTEPIAVIIDAVHSALENAPPELSSDLVDKGIMMAGGGALLKNLDILISKETGLQVKVAETALLSVVLGAGKVLDELDFFRDALLK
jgi:rod shape-determining protein MreB